MSAFSSSFHDDRDRTLTSTYTLFNSMSATFLPRHCHLPYPNTNSPLNQWSDFMLQASHNLQRPLDGAKSYASQLADAGFVNIVEKKFKWPQNAWPKDPKYKELGMWSLENIAGGLQGLSMALFTRGLGWSATELEVFLAGVRKDMKDKGMHVYYDIYVVYGQKPE